MTSVTNFYITTLKRLMSLAAYSEDENGLQVVSARPPIIDINGRGLSPLYELRLYSFRCSKKMF